jgi:hypothetical protein
MISEFQFQQMMARLHGKRAWEPVPDAVSREVEDLHEPIIRWCMSQIPMVPFIHARTDQKSTIGVGAPDFVIFYRGNAILAECKTATGKVRPEQLGWHMAAEFQGFKVHIVRSMTQFYEIVSSLSDPRVSAGGSHSSEKQV